MTDKIDLVRAWKDQSYRESLPEEIQAKLPDPPENLDEMSDEELAKAAGAQGFGVGPAAAAIGSATALGGLGGIVTGTTVEAFAEGANIPLPGR